MSRPTSFTKDKTLYWTIRLYTSAGALVDADSTPTIAVRKNGASTADSVTVTKRAATTGIYDCSYNPASEVEGDIFEIEESATISSTAYTHTFTTTVTAVALTAAGVNTEVDTALADYDGPTKAELDAGFAALNDLSAAEVNAQVDTALSDYDSPTKAEMDAGLAALNDLSAAQVNAEVDTALSDYDGPTRAEATSDKAEILTRLGTPADTDVSTDIANVKTEVDKVPRQGSTHRHRQTAANTGNKSADVIIEAAS